MAALVLTAKIYLLSRQHLPGAGVDDLNPWHWPQSVTHRYGSRCVCRQTIRQAGR